MRVITGNPVAVKAIREGHTNPWPDGTAFAKIAWKSLLKPSGEITPGQFLQVEFMLKDQKKYAATGGWGWGRWKGDELKPYGKDASFVTECTHCHQPMHFNDLVFSSPQDWKAHAGAEADTSVLDALHWKVITSGIDKSGGTMYTLYGNDPAVAAARKGTAYPARSVLTLVTWKQKEDEHWYGANVPGSLVSVDKLTFDKDGARPDWKHYSGHPLTRVSYLDTAYNEHIMKYITGHKASVMP
jgi:hypothetical protein